RAREYKCPRLLGAGVVDRGAQADEGFVVHRVAPRRPVDGDDGDDAPPVDVDHGSRTATTSPSCTLSSGATRTSVTTPSFGAVTGISIFIDSRITSSSPSATCAPTSVRTCHTLAVISARTSVMAGQLS